MGALPDGKCKADGLADGISPTHGSDREGLTALLQSAGKLPYMLASNGTNLNPRLHPTLLKSEAGKQGMVSLLKTAMQLKIMHMQFNVVDSGRDPKFLIALVKTLFEDFAAVEVWAEREEIGQRGRVTYLVTASNKALERPLLQAQRGLARSWVRWPHNDLRARTMAGSVPLLSDDFAPVDRLMSGLLLAPDL